MKNFHKWYLKKQLFRYKQMKNFHKWYLNGTDLIETTRDETNSLDQYFYHLTVDERLIIFRDLRLFDRTNLELLVTVQRVIASENCFSFLLFLLRCLRNYIRFNLSLPKLYTWPTLISIHSNFVPTFVNSTSSVFIVYFYAFYYFSNPDFL